MANDMDDFKRVSFYEKRLDNIKLEVTLNYNSSLSKNEEQYTIDNPLVVFAVSNLANPTITYESMSVYLKEFQTIESALEAKLEELNKND